jgi:hypothetical protein
MARIRENNFLMDFEDTGLQPSLQQFISAPQIDTEAIARQQIEAQLRAQQEAQARAEALRAQNIARLAAEQQVQQIAEQEAARQVFNQRQVQQPTTLQEAINQISAQAPQQPTTSEPPMATDKATIIDNLVKQIQARSNTSQWSGGVGADQATKDMARILAETGITDISQFGPITQQVEKIVGYEETGEPIYQTVTEQTFGNKLTGQAVPKTYSERQTGNFFGGTFEGKGNTGYGVQFDEQGNPTFFTQGASSRDPIVKAALPIGALALGTLGAQSLFGGAATGATEAGGLLSGGGAGLTAAEAAGLGLTATEAAALGLPAAEFATAASTGGLLSAGGFPLTSIVPETSALASEVAAGGGLLSAAPSIAAVAPEVAAVAPAVASVAPEVVASTVAPAAASAVAPTVASTVAPAVASTAGGLLSSAIPGAGTIGGALASGALSSLGGALGGAVTGGLSNLISGGLGTAGNLLQMQQSREAAQKAQAMIEAETEAAKQAAQFRPVGMTTRFGTSQFEVDPATGRLISAGYTLTPEAKAQQDRLVALQNQGLTQAEQAQAQFAPLQTGAQSLFNLGNQYLAQSPQSVAQNYLNQQLALLQPGRELELANLQNRLQQQGRSGLSVAQGGSYGATTPELQALYNARAMQEAQLAAQAQQAGQQQVQFGAGLLGQGASAMGQYYGGQQAAYAPYTTASGQVQGLEALGQQPLTMGVGLGQQAAQAGARVGELGLGGARISAGLATSADATRNLAAQGLIAAGNPNAMFGQAIGGLLGGGARALFSQTPLGSSGFGTGLAYSNQDMGLYF